MAELPFSKQKIDGKQSEREDDDSEKGYSNEKTIGQRRLVALSRESAVADVGTRRNAANLAIIALVFHLTKNFPIIIQAERNTISPSIWQQYTRRQVIKCMNK